MKFVIQGNINHNDVQTMSQTFFHHMRFDVADILPSEGLCLMVQNAGVNIVAQLHENGMIIQFAEVPITENGIKGIRRATKLALYNIFVAQTGYKPPWGLLTGIRPAKVAAEFLDQDSAPDDIRQALITQYFIDPSRATLCTDVAIAQRRIVAQNPQNAVSIYISVPFCPTICHYCSFSAYPTDRYGKYMDAYVVALTKEVEYLSEISRGKRVENIYIGGGTPTALDDGNFERLLATIVDNFDIRSVIEYTVEAGRPDTITEGKLSLMKQYGVSRISINPQTLNDPTLERIGRKHTASQFFQAYEAAQMAGFDNINIDLILGLPDESINDVRRTLEGVANLRPNSCTIHTLAVKRASKLHEYPEMHSPAEISLMEQMLTVSADYMKSIGLNPYYMYRQKNSAGNFENVGYAAQSFEGRYNIHMMEEVQSIYAAGAGAVTKLVDAVQSRIERVFNLRSPVDYIEKIDEMIARKEGLIKEIEGF